MEPIEIFKLSLIVLLIACAIGAGISKKLLTSVIIFMSYSGVMAIVWALLESPDLAITEAAVGAGVSTILFFLCLKRIGGMENRDKSGDKEKDKSVAQGQEEGSQSKEDKQQSSKESAAVLPEKSKEDGR